MPDSGASEHAALDCERAALRLEATILRLTAVRASARDIVTPAIDARTQALSDARSDLERVAQQLREIPNLSSTPGGGTWRKSE